MEAYISVRAHGLKSRLLTQKDYEALVRGEKKIFDFKDYSLITERDKLEEKLEKVYRVYIHRMETVARADKELGELALALLDRLEIENAKIHLRHLLGAKRPVIYYPYGRHIGPARLSNIRSEGMLWEELSKTAFQTPPTPRFSTGLVAEREVLLEVVYYNYLARVIKGLKVSRSEKEDLENVLSREVELRQALWAKITSPRAVSYLLSEYSPFFRPVAAIPEDLMSLRTTELLAYTQSTLLKELKEKLAVPHNLDLAFVYYFNALALTEANNLEKILVGLEVGAPEEVILRNIIV